MPIGWAIGGMLTLALVVAAGVIAVLFAVGQFQGFQKVPLTASSLYDLLKIGFAFAAGIAGVVALVTAYRRQRVAELAHDLAARTEERETARLFNERFATAAGQLGDDRPAVRLAGLYAMAGLADDWAQQRQVCVNVLCAFLRMPHEPDPGDEAPEADRQVFRAAREVRHTVIRVITDHLQPANRRADNAQDWRGLNLDFTGATFDGGTIDFSGAEFSGGTVNFSGAEFSDGTIDFSGAEFSDGTIDFSGARFSGGTLALGGARFCGGTVYFGHAKISGGTVNFGGAEFSGGSVHFSDAEFSGGTVNFGGAEFSGGTVHFSGAEFSGGTVNFGGAEFSGGTVHFGYARLSGGTIDFSGARLSSGVVSFRRTAFSGGTVDLRQVREGSVLPWNDPPPGVLFPARE